MNTDEAFRRYCEEFGLCNRVVFDQAYRMGREDRLANDAPEMLRLLRECCASEIHRHSFGVGYLSSSKVAEIRKLLERHGTQ